MATSSTASAIPVRPTSAARSVRSSLARNRRWALILSYFFLIVFAIFFLAPPYYMLVTSFKTNHEMVDIAKNPWLITEGFTLEHYRNLIENTDFLIFFKNTVIVTLCVVAITMVISTLAAFALARMKFWGSGLLATGVFLTYLIPDSLLFIPLFQIVKGLGLLNNYWSMVLVYPTLTVPFCTWIMIGYFASIPKELDEAALIDGANYMQILLRIFIPVALPGIIAAMIFAFTVSWAAFVYPMAFLYRSDQLVLTVGTVTSLIRADVFQWGSLMAGALLAAAPPLIVYAFLMDYYIAGLTAGATKG
jgi:multiple sugar transport system permease protein